MFLPPTRMKVFLTSSEDHYWAPYRLNVASFCQSRCCSKEKGVIMILHINNIQTRIAFTIIIVFFHTTLLVKSLPLTGISSLQLNGLEIVGCLTRKCPSSSQ